MKEEKRRTQARRKMDIDYSLKLKLKKQVGYIIAFGWMVVVTKYVV